VVAAGDVWEIFTTNVVVKGLVTLVSIPWIYWVRARTAGVGVLSPEGPPARRT
jgi:hypothetical protein